MELVVLFQAHAKTGFSSRAHAEEFLRMHPKPRAASEEDDVIIGLNDGVDVLLRGVDVLKFMYTETSASAEAAQRALGSLRGGGAGASGAVSSSSLSLSTALMDRTNTSTTSLAPEDEGGDEPSDASKLRKSVDGASRAKMNFSDALAQQRRQFERLQQKYGLREGGKPKSKPKKKQKDEEASYVDRLRRLKGKEPKATEAGPRRRRSVAEDTELRGRLERAREAFAVARGEGGA
uniref:Uncharacterized protein n=1 Tax=Phaeomonas parva TaxID=124430 RepID=A0A7S1UHN3_9STRA